MAEQHVLGDDHPDTLSTRHELASMIAWQGRLEEAETAFRDILEAEQRVLGDNHPDTLSTRHELATVIARQGRLEEAGTAFRGVLEAKERVLGIDHPSTAITRQALGRVPHCFKSASLTIMDGSLGAVQGMDLEGGVT
jgi:thioredoxin-like negative regulator of GroEL